MNRLLCFLLLVLSTSSKGQYTFIIAGHSGSGGYIGDGGPATAAYMRHPYDVAIGKTGNIYVVETGNNIVRKVNPAGIISTVAGKGIIGYSGDGGPATAALLKLPFSVAVDSFENVYVSDRNDVVRKVNTSGIITTVAGGGTSLADGVPATTAALYNPESIALDANGNLYIADGGHSLIRKVDAMGIITTYAGNGIAGFSGDGGPATAAAIRGPRGLRFDAAGNLYFADYANMRVRKISATGIITTIAGNGYHASPGIGGYFGDGGPATNAALNGPNGIGLDRLGNVYISDLMNNVIRRVDTFGYIMTTLGYYSTLHSPTGLAVDTANDLYFANTSEYVVRKFPVHCTPTPITFIRDTICIGSSSIASNSILGGTWSMTNSHAAITSGGRVTAISTGVDTIVYTTSNACGTATVSKRIRILPPPVAGPVTGTDSVCAGSTIILSATPAGGVWSTSNANAAIGTYTGIVTGISPGLDTVTYTISNLCGISSGSAVVRVMPLPVAGVISGVDTLCRGTYITLTATGSAGVWHASNAHATVAGGLVAGVSNGIDTIMYLVTNSCGTDTASHSVIVVYPFAGVISGPSAVCVYDSITLTGSVPGGMWTRTNTFADVSPAGVVSGDVAGLDTIMYVVADACGADTAYKAVVVNPLPVAGTISGPSVGCLGGPLSLTAAFPGGTWYSSNSTGAPVSSVGVVSLLSSGSYTITYLVANGCGLDSVTHLVTTDSPAAPITGDTVVCEGSTVLLSDATAGGAWSSANVYVASVADGLVTGLHSGVSIISYIVANACGTTAATKNMTVISGGGCITSPPVSSGMVLYPNPTRGLFSVTIFSIVDEPATVVVADMLGKKVIEIHTVTNKLIEVMTQAPSGVYFVTAGTSQAKYVSKLVVQ